LKRAQSAELPVERPTKFLLTVNLRTAKALGLVIPESFLIGTDQVRTDARSAFEQGISPLDYSAGFTAEES